MREPLLEMKHSRNADRKHFPLIVMFLLMGGFAFLFYMNMLSKNDARTKNTDVSVEQMIIEEVENGRAKNDAENEKEKGENFTFYKTLVNDPMKPKFDPKAELAVKESDDANDPDLEKEIAKTQEIEPGRGASTFSVQVGSFADFNRADQMVRMLKAQGYDPFILASNISADEKRFRVRFGKFQTSSKASEESTKVNSSQNLKTIVVKD